MVEKGFLASQRIEVPEDIGAANESLYERRLTDGHPVIPPTEERVGAMLAGVDRDPQEELGILGPKFRVATVEKVAICAVMAWCKPEFMPVLVAAVEAIADPAFNLYGLQATTHPTGTPLVIANGPIRNRLGINCGSGCFGHGTRANSTIGRALRLILTNVGGAYPGETDMSTHGWPGKHGFCFGEHEEASPWEPLHVELGFAPSESTVTVVGTGGTYNFGDLWSTTAEGVLTSAANAMSAYGTNNMGNGGQPFLALCPEHAQIVAQGGRGKAEAKSFIFDRLGFPLARYSPEVKEAVVGRRHDQSDGDTLVKPVHSAEDLMVVVAGGPGPHSVFIPTWGGDTHFVTRRVRS